MMMKNFKKNKYIIMSCEQNDGQNIGNKSFERVKQFKYSGTKLKNQNSV